jgi:hypothetical protein
MRLRRSIILLETDRPVMPMAWGIRRARVLVPAESERWTSERRRAVLLHEIAHVRRRDCLTQFLTNLACAMHWFNPLAWLARRRMVAERERACDDLVLAAGFEPSDYAQHLLQIASSLRAGLLTSGAAIAMARPSKLEGRLLAVLDGKRNRRGLTRSLVLAGLVLTIGIAVPLATLRAQGTEENVLNVFEGKLAIEQEIPVKLPALTPRPDVSAQIQSVRFYKSDNNLRAKMRVTGRILPADWHMFVRLELLGDKGECYVRTSSPIPSGGAEGAQPDREVAASQIRHDVDFQCCDFSSATEEVKQFRIALVAAQVRQTDSVVEGDIAPGVMIPIRLAGGSAEQPEIVNCVFVRFEKTDELHAWVRVTRRVDVDSKWLLTAERLDEKGVVLSRGQRTFATRKWLRNPSKFVSDSTELHLSLGRWTQGGKRDRFRLRLERSPNEAAESLEAPFEIDRYSLCWLTADGAGIPDLVMIRGIQFDQLEDGQVRAMLRVGGKELAAFVSTCLTKPVRFCVLQSLLSPPQRRRSTVRLGARGMD